MLSLTATLLKKQAKKKKVINPSSEVVTLLGSKNMASKTIKINFFGRTVLSG